VTNEQFQDMVSRAFGSQARQHPLLDCAKDARVRGLLKPVAMTNSAPPAEFLSHPDGRIPEASALHSSSGKISIDSVVLNQLLKTLSTLLEARGA
jgi:hypothetical protein